MCNCQQPHIGCASCNCQDCSQRHVGFSPGRARSVAPVPSHLLGLVPKPTDTVITVKPTAPDVERDTMPLIVDKARRTAWQVEKLARELKGKNLAETLRNNSNFILKYIKYEKDDPKHEQIRSPRRTIHDGKGDCDCFSVLLAALLINQGINFRFRIAKYQGNPSAWTHIYIVVPKNQARPSFQPGQYYTLDPVTNSHDSEVKFLRKKDYDMALQSLDGLGDCSKSQDEFLKKRPGETVPLKHLLNRGYRVTTDILASAQIPFQADNEGTVFIQTQNGIQKLPAMLSPQQVKQLRQQMVTQPVNGLAAAPEKTSAWWLLIPALAIGALAFGGNTSLSGVGKKHVPVIHL